MKKLISSFILFFISINCMAIDTLLRLDIDGVTPCPACALYGAEGNFGVNRIHTGSDFLLNIDSKLKAMSFGKIKFRNNMPVSGAPHSGRPDHGMGNVLEIEYLLDDGVFISSSYNHLNSFPSNVEVNDYISSSQIIAYSGASGQQSLTYWNDEHLHFEIRDNYRTLDENNALIFPWGYTSNSVNPDTYGYSDPYDYIDNRQIALPILSKTPNPDRENNYDVYGVTNQQIYGSLNLTGTFENSSIVVRKFSTGLTTRSRVGDKGILNDTDRFLGGRNKNSDVDGINGNSSSYLEGDYLFAPWLIDNGETRYGYPIKFSFVNKGDFIIDNDKESYSDGSLYIENIDDATVTNKVTGYFLSAKLAQSTEDNIDNVNWQLSSYIGYGPVQDVVNYNIYAHIPNGSTATVKYEIHSTDGLKRKEINQSNHINEWVYLGSYNMSSDNSYVSLSLEGVDSGEWVAFDAIKFEKTSIFDGTGSLIDPQHNDLPDGCFGCEHDYVALHSHGKQPSAGFFQVFRIPNVCESIRLDGLGDARVEVRTWDGRGTNSKYYNVSGSSSIIPLMPVLNSSWLLVAFETNSPIPVGTSKTVEASCLSDSHSSILDVAGTPLRFANEYFWGGNGSLITQTNNQYNNDTKAGYGRNRDTAILHGLLHKTLSVFQVTNTDSCRKVRFKTPISLNLSWKLWNDKEWKGNKTISDGNSFTFPTSDYWWILKIKASQAPLADTLINASRVDVVCEK